MKPTSHKKQNPIHANVLGFVKTAITIITFTDIPILVMLAIITIHILTK